jgi:23S rRNA pseudouridine1911/1915/1917 synthase
MDIFVKPPSHPTDELMIGDEAIDDADYFDGVAAALEPITLQLEDENQGIRLDKVLSTRLPHFSRARIQQWIEEGYVLVDGKPAKVRSMVLGGEVVTIEPQMAQHDQAFGPEPIALDVVYEDEALLVVNKPADLVVHPAAGNWTGTLLNGLLHHCPQLQGVPRAGIVHRLDKDTSGLLVVAKTLIAQTDLVRQLQQRTVNRHYLALVWGQPVSSGRIEAAAITHYQKVASGQLNGRTVTLLRCQLETGRTHQIRVHLQSLGFPIVGDAVYGKPHLASVFPRQALHAERLGLVHPVSGIHSEWHVGLPLDMANLLQQAGMSI